MEGGEPPAADEDEQPDLGELLDQALSQPAGELVATRHGGGIPTATRPQLFTCNDTRLYAVKFMQNGHGDGKGIFNEQVVAALGRLLGAPVAPVELVNVSQDLVNELMENAAANHLDFEPAAGVHHGSRWQDNHSGRQTIAHVDENRARFGALDVLHAWTGCSGDQQWIYGNAPPYPVLSTDHTAFFPEGFAWTAATIAGQHANVAQDPVLGAVGLAPADRQAALDRLAAVRPEDIAAAVARPPAAWGVGRDDRLALAEFLAARKDPVIALLS